MAVQKKELGELKLAKPKDFKGQIPKKLASVAFLYAEPKLDGLRGVAIVRNGQCRLYTSSGVRVVNGPGIRSDIKSLGTVNGVFDGEFFAENWNLTNSLVKTQSKHPRAKELCFRVFDALTLEEWDAKECKTVLFKRKLLLNSVGKSLLRKKLTHVAVVPLHEVKPDLKEMDDFFRDCLKAGHEGAVFKNPDSLYSFRRSDDWLKTKPFFSADLRIVDSYEGTGKHKGKLGGVFCEGTIDGKHVKTKVGGGFTDKERVRFWLRRKQKRLIGTIIEVRHEGLTKNNAVRFPRFSRDRWDKTKPN